jgi:hypothetical protein
MVLGFTEEEAKLGLEKCEGSYDKAAEYLLNEEQKHYLEENKEDLSDLGSISYEGLSCDNFFYNLILFVKSRLEASSNYCFVCLTKHLADSVKLRPCEKELCEFSFEESFGAKVLPILKSNMDMAMLDMTLASRTMLSNRVT